MGFRKLLREFSGANSLEAGSRQHVRYNAFSNEGAESIRLYEKAVGIMKEKSAVDQADPYGWSYQAGIHGTFWNTMNQLTSLASERGFGTPEHNQVILSSITARIILGCGMRWHVTAKLVQQTR